MLNGHRLLRNKKWLYHHNPPKKLVSGAADSLHKASCDSSVIQLAPEARVDEGKEAISIEQIKLWSRDIKGDY